MDGYDTIPEHDELCKTSESRILKLYFKTDRDRLKFIKWMFKNEIENFKIYEWECFVCGEIERDTVPSGGRLMCNKCIKKRDKKWENAKNVEVQMYIFK